MSEKATGAVVEKVCTRCKVSARTGAHAWCKGCQAAARKARRTSNPVSNDVSNAMSNVSNVQSGDEAPEVLAASRKSAAVRVVELEDEVRRLKRALAERAPVSGGQAVRVPVRGVRDGEVCIHGSAQCGVLYCRAGRS